MNADQSTQIKEALGLSALIDLRSSAFICGLPFLVLSHQLLECVPGVLGPADGAPPVWFAIPLHCQVLGGSGRCSPRILSDTRILRLAASCTDSSIRQPCSIQSLAEVRTN